MSDGERTWHHDAGRKGNPGVSGMEAFVHHVVSAAHGVSVPELFAATRSRASVALARQVAMYLGHVSCGLTLTEAGVGLGRDRTTAAHACHRIEDRRDDATFDTALDYLDAAVRARMDRRGSQAVRTSQGSGVAEW